MSKASRVSCLFLIFASVGSVQSTDPSFRTALLGPPARDSERIEAKHVYNFACALAAEGKYLKAQELFRKLLPQCKVLGDMPMAGRCLTSIGNTQFSLFQYRAALDSYLGARAIAESSQDQINLASLNLNISALLLQMGDLEESAHSAEQALAGFDRQDYRGG